MNGFIYIFSASTLHMKSDKSITDTSCHIKMNTSTIQKLVHVNEQYFFICFFLFFRLVFFFIGFVSCSFCIFHSHFLQATVNYMQYILTMHHHHHSFIRVTNVTWYYWYIQCKNLKNEVATVHKSDGSLSVLRRCSYSYIFHFGKDARSLFDEYLFRLDFQSLLYWDFGFIFTALNRACFWHFLPRDAVFYIFLRRASFFVSPAMAAVVLVYTKRVLLWNLFS